MIRRPKLISLDGEEPVSLAECKAHLRVDTADEDALITAMALAAREYCEEFTGLALSLRTLELAIDAYPANDDPIELPFGPVREIVSVATNGIPLDEATYMLDDYAAPAALWPADTWPAITAATNAVAVRYVAGYGLHDMQDMPLPWSIRAALLLVLGTLYEHREETTDRAVAALPLGVEALLRPHRVRLGMA